MFTPQFQISQKLLATLKHIAVQVHVLNTRRPTAEIVATLRDETQRVAAAAVSHGNEQAGANYRQTLQELGHIPAADFELALLLRIHFRLCSGVLPEGRRGRLRREDLEGDEAPIGETAYRPPEPRVMPVMLNDLVTFIQGQRETFDPVLLAAIFHRQLLLIRPFAGSNEAAAWLATKILLSDLGLERLDLLALEDRFLADRDGYLAALGLRGNYQELTGAREFTPWLEYFVEGVSAELTALEMRYRRHQATPARALRAHHRALLEYVDEHGFITDKQYARLTDRAKATRSLDFKKLMELDLLVREGKGRGTYYRRKM